MDKNREIRFRAWDKEKKAWVDDILMTMNKYAFIYEYDRCEFWGTDRKIVLCQFTGLKDKHGTPIYESDIVEYISHGRTTERKRGEIIWEGYGWNIDGFYCGYYDVSTDAWAEGIKVLDLEVIGNIYEHPHLLDSAGDE